MPQAFLQAARANDLAEHIQRNSDLGCTVAAGRKDPLVVSGNTITFNGIDLIQQEVGEAVVRAALATGVAQFTMSFYGNSRLVVVCL